MKGAISHTIAYIKLLAQDLAECDLDCVLLAILFDLKMPVTFDGFEYLKAAVVMQYENPTMDLVNDIYVRLADRYGVNSDMIASAVRGIITAGWKRADRELWYLYLPTIPRGKNGAPTNAEVIAGLARILELWQGCAKAYLRQQRKEVVSNGRN